MSVRAFRGWVTALGIALFVLAVAGFSNMFQERWLAWTTLLAAIFCGIGAGATQNDTPKRVRGGGMLALATGLVVNWLAGLGSHAVGWMVWWNCAFAFVGYLIGFAAFMGPESKHEIRGIRRAA